MNEQALDPLPAHIAYMPGSRMRRIGAFIIDMLLLGVVGLSLVYLIPEIFDALGRWSFMTGYLIAGLYFSIFDSTILTGQTIGKKVLNLRVVNRDGATVGLVSVAARFLLALTPWFLNGRPFPADWLSQTFCTINHVDLVLG